MELCQANKYSYNKWHLLPSNMNILYIHLSCFSQIMIFLRTVWTNQSWLTVSWSSTPDSAPIFTTPASAAPAAPSTSGPTGLNALAKDKTFISMVQRKQTHLSHFETLITFPKCNKWTQESFLILLNEIYECNFRWSYTATFNTETGNMKHFLWLTS